MNPSQQQYISICEAHADNVAEDEEVDLPLLDDIAFTTIPNAQGARGEAVSTFT